MMTDPISDMLTRIRNAVAGHKEWVDIPASKVKLGIAEVLRREGYIQRTHPLEVGKKKFIRLYLKYGPEGEQVIQKIRRVSTPGRRVYRGSEEVGTVLRGLGTYLVSTSQGILTDRECREKHLGGEVLACLY
ncbi:MAG: 30S ribosomal protein S8 [Planctomycetes bacterium]|nr:30S ribosomal protein S8 [Planctomycetota bacterium]